MIKYNKKKIIIYYKIVNINLLWLFEVMWLNFLIKKIKSFKFNSFKPKIKCLIIYIIYKEIVKLFSIYNIILIKIQ